MILKPYLQLGKRTETTPYYLFSSEKPLINLLHKCKHEIAWYFNG